MSYEIKGADVVICFQVLEHIDDDNVGIFAKKLINDGRIAVVSVPYMWAEGKGKWHVQDPIDVEKLTTWFGKNPAFLYVVTEKDKLARIIAVFIHDYNPEIDLEYWREDAERALKLNQKRRFFNRIRGLCLSIIKKR